MSDKQKYPGPLYAAAGFGDLAAEKLRELPGRVSGLQDKAREELSGGRDRAQTDLAELGGKLGARLASVRDRVGHLSEADLRTLRGTARKRAGELAGSAQRNLVTAQGRAAEAYEGLVSRGSTVLDGPEVVEPPAVEPRPAKKMAKKATRPAAKKPTGK